MLELSDPVDLLDHLIEFKFLRELELNEMVEKINRIGELKHIDLIPV